MRIRRSPCPRDQFVRDMQRRIDERELKDGERIAPRRAIEQQRNVPVSASTVNDAFAILKQLHYVETRPGRYGGTYVIGPERRKEMTPAAPQT